MNQLDQLKISQFKRVYFIGIGGIGMSALARYFMSIGLKVSGYDKTPSELTSKLIAEGITIHFEDNGNQVPVEFHEVETTLVVYTPAIPSNMGELCFFQENKSILLKRSQVLGLLTRQSLGLGVAGTHGKTTTSSMLAHIMNQSSEKCNAFLGGIATNFESNLLLNPTSQYTVIEADEFDRSFLQLSPFASIITSTDPDHLDIYGDKNHFLEGFEKYSALIHPAGCLVEKVGLKLPTKAKKITYGIASETADFNGINLRFDKGQFLMDVVTKSATWEAVEMNIPGIHNAENAVACIALLSFLGVSEQEIRSGLASFKGVKRRFEYHVKKNDLIYIDDYAHHPTELNALISSIRMLYPTKKIIGAFQPHLFSRTRDFFDAFANELSQLDELILLPIYPARELPIEGVTSDRLFDKISIQNKQLLDAPAAYQYLSTIQEGVVLTIGAGDIDRIVEPLKNSLI
jgi:UDP-N-acetylmuramate--alanine ligase